MIKTHSASFTAAGLDWQHEPGGFRKFKPIHPGMPWGNMFTCQWYAPGKVLSDHRVVPDCAAPEFTLTVNADNQEPQHFVAHFDLNDPGWLEKHQITVSLFAREPDLEQ